MKCGGSADSVMYNAQGELNDEAQMHSSAGPIVDPPHPWLRNVPLDTKSQPRRTDGRAHFDVLVYSTSSRCRITERERLC